MNRYKIIENDIKLVKPNFCLNVKCRLNNNNSSSLYSFVKEDFKGTFFEYFTLTIFEPYLYHCSNSVIQIKTDFCEAFSFKVEFNEDRKPIAFWCNL